MLAMYDDFEKATPCSEPKPMLRFGLHNSLHRLLHNGKLGQSGKQEKSFASGTKSFPLLNGRWLVSSSLRQGHMAMSRIVTFTGLFVSIVLLTQYLGFWHKRQPSKVENEFSKEKSEKPKTMKGKI